MFRAAMLLAVMMMMTLGAQTALAQTYTLGGNYVKFSKFVQPDPEEAGQYVDVTEAAAGDQILVYIDYDANFPENHYPTGDYSSNQVTVTKNYDEDGRYNGFGHFTMPAQNVTVNAVVAAQEQYTIDLTSATSQVIPESVWILLNGLADNWLIDLNNDGKNDLQMKEDYNESTGVSTYSVIRLAGADNIASDLSIPLSYVYPLQYNSVLFKLKSKKAVQSGWITLSGTEFTYTGQPIEPTVTVKDGTKDITQQFNISYNNNENAGEATVTVTANAAGYTGSATKTFTIAPKPVTISGVKANDKVYDGNVTADIDISGATITGKVDDDDLTIVTGSATFADANAGEGKNVTFSGFTLTGAQAGNYTLSAQPASVKATIKPVTRITVTITGRTYKDIYDGVEHQVEGYTISCDNKVYTAADIAFKGTDVASRIDFGTTNMGLRAEQFENVNSNFDKVTFDVTDGFVTIEQKEVTVTTGSATKEYDGTPLVNSEASITGLVPGEKATVIAKGSQTDVGYSTNIYEIVWDSAKATNYKVVKEDLGRLVVTENPDPVKETKTETVENADGSKTETTTTMVRDASGKLISESIQEITTRTDGSQIILTIMGSDGSPVANLIFDDQGRLISLNFDVQGGKSFSNLGAKGQVVVDHLIQNSQGYESGSNQILIETGSESNVLLGKTTEISTDGIVLATSSSMTIKQTDATEDGTAAGPTRIAINTGGSSGSEDTGNDNGGGTGDDNAGGDGGGTLRYTITWLDEEGGNALLSETYAYGEIPEAPSPNPTKAEDDKFTYTFKEWKPSIVTVTGDATYYAVFEAIPKTGGDNGGGSENPENPQDATQTKDDANPQNLAMGDKIKITIGESESASENYSKSYSYEPVRGVTVEATLTAKLVSGSDNIYEVTGNQATKVTFGLVQWKSSGALFTRPSNITFNGANINTARITFALNKFVETNSTMTLISDFGTNVGTITGTSFHINNGAQDEGHAYIEGSDIKFIVTKGKESESGQSGTEEPGTSDPNPKPFTRDQKDRAATTMTVNYETKEVTGGAGSGAVYGGKSNKVTVDNDLVNFTGGTVNKIIGGGSRAATAEEENDEIEIVSGQEYKLLHDGYIVLNFYTPSGPITVKSIIIRRPGDANNDGYVDAADLVEMINAKANKPSERFNLTNADIDRDGTITQNDIDAVVKIIMGD